MGARTLVLLSGLVAVIGIGVLYFNEDLNKRYPIVGKAVEDVLGRAKSYLQYFGVDDKANDNGKAADDTKPNQGARLLTPAELRKYDATAGSLGLYLAVLGKVYDVQSGSQHYRPGGAYAFFTGRDASRAYLTGDFQESGLSDDLSGLADDVVLGITTWVDLYEKDYKYVGKLIGRYYDESGKATEALVKVQEAIKRGHSGQKKEQDEKEIFPPCNSEWDQERGGRVWCSKQSGGITRNWAGVPRLLKSNPASTSTPRCACVKTTGPPSFVAQFQPATIDLTRGDLDHPHLKEYPNCPSDSDSCPLGREPILPK